MSDMLVKLYALEDESLFVPRRQDDGVSIKQAYRAEKRLILDFVKANFDSPLWPDECEAAIVNDPVSCFIAVKDRELIGFACYDATTRGFFGPTGVKKEFRRRGIGGALLRRTLFAMREHGYAYAVIGWVAPDAVSFYEKTVNAVLIEDSPREKSIFRNMIEIE